MCIRDSIQPVTDNDIDLGADGKEFKDLYIDGTANIDTGIIGSANVGSLIFQNETGTMIIFGADADQGLTWDDSEGYMQWLAKSGEDLKIVFNADGNQLSPDNGDMWLFKVADGGNFSFGNDKSGSFVDHLTIVPGNPVTTSTMTAKGNLYVDSHLSVASSMSIGTEIYHISDADNKIAFGTDTQSFETGGTARINLSDSGLQIGTGARVTTILDEDGLSSDSATALATQQSIKAYVDANAGSGGAGIYGTPVNNQLAVWKDSSTIEGESELTYDGTTLSVIQSNSESTFIKARSEANMSTTLDGPRIDLDRYPSDAGMDGAELGLSLIHI